MLLRHLRLPDGRFRSWPSSLLSLFLLAGVVRIAFVLLYPQVPVGLGDDQFYDDVGWNLAQGEGFSRRDTEAPVRFPVQPSPTTRVGPVYPAFLALTYLGFGRDYAAVRVIQALISAASLLILYPRVRQVFGKDVANISGILIAVHPAIIIASGMLLTETLFLFLSCLLVSVLIGAVQSESAWRWALAGMVMGVTILLRQEALAMVPVFMAVILWRFPARHLIRKLALFLLLTFLTVGTWTARNYRVFQEFLLVTDRGGPALWIATKGWTEWPAENPERQALTEGATRIEQNRILRREAIRNIQNDPIRYFALGTKRLVYHLWIGSHTTYLAGFRDTYKQLYVRGASGKLFVKISMLAANTFLILAGAWGAFTTLRHEKKKLGLMLFFLVSIVVTSIVHFFFFATQRYTVPVMPFVLVFSATWFRQIWLHRRRPVAISTACI